MREEVILSNVVFHHDEEGKFDGIICNVQTTIFRDDDSVAAQGSDGKATGLSTLTPEDAATLEAAYNIIKKVAGA